MKSASSRTEPTRPFSAVLDALQRNLFSADEPASRRPAFSAAPTGEPAYVPKSVLGRLYETMRAAAKGEPAPPPPPSVDLQDIAHELGIRPEHSIDGLIALRRRFAFANHPDRCVAALREVATIRMGTANMLIDRALAARRALQSRS